MGKSPRRKKKDRVSRAGSPTKFSDLINVDPMLHRAVARGMYYDEMVNIVPAGKGSPKKIKHGGMNLFTAKGQPDLTTEVYVDEDGNVMTCLPKGYSPPRKSNWGPIDYELGESPTTIKNSDYAKRTYDVQREF